MDKNRYNRVQWCLWLLTPLSVCMFQKQNVSSPHTVRFVIHITRWLATIPASTLHERYISRIGS